MSTGEWQETEEPEIGARLLVLCREVRFDAGRGDSPYSLNGLLAVFKAGSDFPVVWHEPVYLYAEYFGAGGDYEVWFDLFRFATDEDGEILDEIEEAGYGPFVLTLAPDAFVNRRSYYLGKLPFQAAGVHEFRLRIAGMYEPLIAQRFLVKE